MSDPSANDSSDRDTDAGGGEVSTAVDGGESASAVNGGETASSPGSVDGDGSANPTASADPSDSTATAVTTDTAPPDESMDSPLRAIGAAFGLGVLGILGLLAISTVVGGAIFIVARLTGQQPSLAVSFVVPFAVSQIVAFLGVGLGYLRWRGLSRSEMIDYLGVRRPSALEFVIAVIGPVLVLITALTVGSIVLLFGTEPAQNQGAAMTLENPTIIPIMIVAMLLVVGPCEEFLFRGVIQSRARETFSAVPAIFLAAAVFAPAHIVSLTGGLSAMLATISILFVPSLLFGAVYEYTENLVVVAVMHGLYNSLLLTIGYIAIRFGPELEEAGQAGAALLGL
ncbi:lysostaphin resistance A-like protein [Halorubrum sp. DTA46]|uniref:CPBP family intramembrane glutamic endopeptidase n=1 Tax=Halorubrum sp. DTA46 TaxID=3402162 RepID=UPI003AAEE1A0